MSNTEYGLRRIALSSKEISTLTTLVIEQITVVQELPPSQRADSNLTHLRGLLDKLAV